MDECSFCTLVSKVASFWRKKDVFDSPSIYDTFIKGKEIGSGSYATVRKCKSRLDGKNYAIKIINKKKLDKEDKQALEDEISILQKLDHPKVMKFYSRFEDVKNIYLVTELIPGGQLFHRIIKKQTYTEKETVETCSVLLNAIKYCHDRNIVHRDIKPENILLTSEQSDTDVKISDFGFAAYVNGENRKTFCGSPFYVASEIVRQRLYGVKVDMWSIGVIIFTLLSGKLPFEDHDLNSLFRKIALGQFKFRERDWKNVSKEAKDLVTGLLQTDPNKRFSAEEALESKWLRERSEVLASRSLRDCQVRLRRFITRKKIRGAIRSVTIREIKSRAA